MKSFGNVGFVLVSFGLLVPADARGAGEADCIACHRKVTPGIVSDWEASRHRQQEVSCDTCHGTDHTTAEDAAKARIPTPDTCAPCHESRVEEFKRGKHALGWTAMKAMPTTHWLPMALTEGMKGCGGCHKIGLKTDAEIRELKKEGPGFGLASCDACHTRHTFSAAEARQPQACQTCHMGFDHPQWEMWSTSKHGTIWQIEGTGSKRAPVCQTCHMPGGDHGVMTSWGFLALRLPEDDQEWMNDRVTILKALGVLDSAGQPTARLDVVKAGKVARLTKEEFQKERDKMLAVCSKCHGPSYAKAQLEQGDQVIKAADRVFAEAIMEVNALYRDGLLKKPAGWDFAPDLLQFYEAKSSVEQELYLMFLEYRMRAFQGAFHANPDYMHWYGWAALKESAARIKEDAAKMRAEKGMMPK